MAPRQLDPRKMMKKAIEVMRESVVEGRKDGKKNPAVGSVLVKANGTSESACRGELRDGDHAEFTLLERKNRGKALDGCVLFTTLEPCAPGARTHPKLSCAERIVRASRESGSASKILIPRSTAKESSICKITP